MLGKHLFSVLGERHCVPLEKHGIAVQDEDGGALYQKIIASKYDFDRRCTLSYCSLEDLELPQGSTTKEIYVAAEELGADMVPYNIALQLQIQRPRLFNPNFWHRLLGEKFPFTSCLLGIKPLVGTNGTQYVVEIEDGIFRFKTANESTRWSNQEYWVFVT